MKSSLRAALTDEEELLGLYTLTVIFSRFAMWFESILSADGSSCSFTNVSVNSCPIDSQAFQAFFFPTLTIADVTSQLVKNGSALQL